MSLRPTQQNTDNVGIMLSAQDWARYAISADKKSSLQGFERFWVGEWYHPEHYKHISKIRPEFSKKDALDEMTQMRGSCVREIMQLACELDDMIMRLQRMEEQMREVINSDE